MASRELPRETWEDWNDSPSTKQERKFQTVPKNTRDIKQNTRPGSYAGWAAPAQPNLVYERAVFTPRCERFSNSRPQSNSHAEVTPASLLTDKANTPKRSNGVNIISKSSSKEDGSSSIEPIRLASTIIITPPAQNGDHTLANQQSIQTTLCTIDSDEVVPEPDQTNSDVAVTSASITQDAATPGKQVIELKDSPAKDDGSPTQSVKSHALINPVSPWSSEVSAAQARQPANDVRAGALCGTPPPRESSTAISPGTPAVSLSQSAEDSQGVHLTGSKDKASDTIRSPYHVTAEPLDLKARIVRNLAKQKQAKEAKAAAKRQEEQTALKLAREQQHLKEEQERAAAELSPSEEHSADEGVNEIQVLQHQQVALPETKGPTRQPPSDKHEDLPVTERWSTASQAATTGSNNGDLPNQNQPQGIAEMTGNAHNDNQVHVERDIRGGDLTMPSVRVDWDACRERRRGSWMQESASSELQFRVDSELERYIKFWLKSAHDRRGRPVAPTCIQGHESRDVDTETGRLLDPVQFVKIKPFPDDKTPEARAHKHFAGVPMPNPKQELPITVHSSSLLPSSPITSNSDIQPDESDQSTDIQVPCHLRPATLADMQGIAEVYNIEVRDSHRTIDSNKVPEKGFVELYHKLKAQNAPFIVTVKGWHAEDTQSRKPRRRDKSAVVIGFAFVDVLTQGVAGSSETCAATCGRITVIVHPSYRRKRVGTALMDRILSCCSMDHSPYQGHQFVNPDINDKRFLEPIYNPRKWRSLYLEVLIRTPSLPSSSQHRDLRRVLLTAGEREKKLREHEEWWVAEWLDQRFAMTLVEHRSFVYKHTSKEQRKTEWLDCLVMRHLCRFDRF